MSWRNFYDSFILGVGGPEDTPVKIPFLGMVLGPEGLFSDRLSAFLRLAFFGGIGLAALALLLGRAYVCNYSHLADNFYCLSSIAFWLVHFVLKLFLLGFFALYWHYAVAGEPLPSLRQIWPQWRQAGRVALWLLILGVSGIIPFISLFVLQIREPDPDWRIELTFFTFVGLGFLVHFIAVRFLSAFAFIAVGDELPPLSRIWLRGRGNTAKILISAFVILMLAFLIFNSFYFNFRAVEASAAPWAGIIIEFLYGFFFLIFFTLFLNHCLIQKTYLFDGVKK